MVGIGNALNINQTGFQTFNNTTGVFLGRTLQQGVGITITNGNGQSGDPVISLTGGGSAIEHLTGNSGGQLNPDGSNNFNILGTGSITIAGAGSTLTTQLTGLTNHAIQIGAGTSTLTQLAADTTGKVLQTNTGADPTWSTATYPSTSSTNGNLLTSDGTNWISSSPSFIKTATITLTNAQLKSIRTTPITVISAQGANTVITIFYTTAYFIYGGNNAFTGTNALNLYYKDNTTTSIVSILGAATMIGTTSSILNSSVSLSSTNTVANFINQPILVSCPVADYAGNAANDNTVEFRLNYYVTTF